VKSYIQDIAQIYGVDPHIRYGTSVLDVEKQDDQWSVRTRDRRGNNLISGTKGQAREEHFDAVVVASGHYNAPRVPDIPGLSSLKQRFPDHITHSKGYRGPETLIGKNILLIGTGASAFDIARDAVRLAGRVYHSW
jgi:cation diffusion facilitator CzcD-associated flavoprotein CzcO